MMSTWSDCEPHYGEFPVHHKVLKAMIAIGTFVLYNGDKIGRLVTWVSEGYQPDNQVLVNEFGLVRNSTLDTISKPSRGVPNALS
jgi:hypothetical protein